MTSKKVDYEWTLKHQQAFDALKEAMTTAPVLGKPDYMKDWVLEVDAIDQVLGAVLGQLHDDEEVHLVYFWSRQLTKAERNYHVMDQECLAIITTCIKLCPYILEGKLQFMVTTPQYHGYSIR